MSLAQDARILPPKLVRHDIVRAFWQRDCPNREKTEDLQWDVYFQYYTAECKNAIQYGQGTFTTLRTHEQIVLVAGELRQGFSKNDVKRWLRSSLKQQRNEKEEEQMLEGSVRLASRLLTMTDIGPVPYGIQGSPSMDWVDGATSLKEFLATYFQESQPEKEVRFKFEQAFNAYNLRRYTGVEIVWTDNLADHLRLMDDDARLCVFSHVAFLRNQNSGLFPHGLIDETLRTLALLFPRNDMRTKKWLQVLVSRGEKSLDPELMKCRRLKSNERRAESFRFWHDELLALQEKFEEPAPTSITQLWYDRRVKAQWYTFWIAVSVLCLTIFFGTVQSIEGALQVYKAYHPAADSHGSNLGTKYEKP